MKVSYLKNNEINLKEWDECVRQAYNGSFYGLSWFLNICHEDWSALVLADYQAVMPLFEKTGFGIKYLYPPAFVEQSGIYSRKVLDGSTIDAFLSRLALMYDLVFYPLNTYLAIPGEWTSKHMVYNIYEKDLIQNYDSLKDRFSERARRITKGQAGQVPMVQNISQQAFFNFLAGKTVSSTLLTKDNKPILQKLVSNSIQYKTGSLVGIFDAANQLCCTAFYISSHNKITFLYYAINQEGIRINAQYHLLDGFFKSNAERALTLSFQNDPGGYFSNALLEFGGKVFDNKILEINNLKWLKRLFFKKYLKKLKP